MIPIVHPWLSAVAGVIAIVGAIILGVPTALIVVLCVMTGFLLFVGLKIRGKLPIGSAKESLAVYREDNAMRDFYKIGGGGAFRTTKCAGCGIPMRVATGPSMIRATAATQVQWCFECGTCHRCTCYDCSDNRVPCKCGADNWWERIYLPLESK